MVSNNYVHIGVPKIFYNMKYYNDNSTSVQPIAESILGFLAIS